MENSTTSEDGLPSDNRVIGDGPTDDEAPTTKEDVWLVAKVGRNITLSPLRVMTSEPLGSIAVFVGASARDVMDEEKLKLALRSVEPKTTVGP